MSPFQFFSNGEEKSSQIPEDIRTYIITPTMEVCSIVMEHIPMVNGKSDYYDVMDYVMKYNSRIFHIRSAEMARLLATDRIGVSARTPRMVVTVPKVTDTSISYIDVEEQVPFESLKLAHQVMVRKGQMKWPTKNVRKTIEVPGETVYETILTDHPSVRMREYCPTSYKTAYSQQLVAAWVAYNIEKCALWYQQRTGKTLSVIMAMRRWIDEDRIDKVIIVCPKTNIHDPWMKEFMENNVAPYGWDVYPFGANSSYDEDEAGFNSHKIVILGYERVRNREFVEQYTYGNGGRTLVVFDETTAIKNPLGARARANIDLARHCRYVVALNGTPVSNSASEIWPQFAVIDPAGSIWGGSYSQFSERWLQSRGMSRMEPVDYDAFEGQCLSHSMRCTKEEADQVSGRTGAKYTVSIPPSKEQIDDTVAAIYGFMRKDESGSREAGEREPILSLILRLREIAAGYDKFVSGFKNGKPVYRKVRHKVDPKAMWVVAHTRAFPDKGLVVFVEFNEQEDRLKEMLDEYGIKYKSLRGDPKRLIGRKFKDRIDEQDWNSVVDIVNTNASMAEVWAPLMFTVPVDGKIVVPQEIKYNEQFICSVIALSKSLDGRLSDDERRRIEKLALFLSPTANASEQEVAFAKAKIAEIQARTTDREGYDVSHLLEDYAYTEPGKPLPPQDRAAAIDAFNRGDVQIFICKSDQGKGFSLNRKKGIETGRCEIPEIFVASPTWKLDSFDQSVDRCMGVNSAEGKSNFVRVYVAQVIGTIEAKLLKALSEKRAMADAILGDTKREGHVSLGKELLEDMMSLNIERIKEEDMFDAEKLLAMICLSISPTSKLTESLIKNKLKAAGPSAENNWAAELLLSKVKK